jgi:3-dehydroquinate dehydratase-2
VRIGRHGGGTELKSVLLIHGPNLNMLGTREPGIYGSFTMEDVNRSVTELAKSLAVTVETFHSNHEGEIVDKIQSLLKSEIAGILINPGAYTHTSIAIRDALLAVGKPCVEVHCSNVHKREEFRRLSYISDVAVGTVVGFGLDSYLLGLRGLIAAIK